MQGFTWSIEGNEVYKSVFLESKVFLGRTNQRVDPRTKLALMPPNPKEFETAKRTSPAPTQAEEPAPPPTTKKKKKKNPLDALDSNPYR